MTIWVILLCILLAAVVAFLVYGYSLPAKWQAQASALVPAEADALFAYLTVIRHWEEWTIWNNDEPGGFQFHYEGPTHGPGATQIWAKGRQSGRVQIRATHEGRRIGLMFMFGHSQHMIESELELRPRGRDTEVIWTARGDAGRLPARRIMARMFVPFMQKDFSRSLDRLRSRMAAA